VASNCVRAILDEQQAGQDLLFHFSHNCDCYRFELYLVTGKYSRELCVTSVLGTTMPDSFFLTLTALCFTFFKSDVEN